MDLAYFLALSTLAHVAFVGVNFLVDILHGIIDPRLRAMERAA